MHILQIDPEMLPLYAIIGGLVYLLLMYVVIKMACRSDTLVESQRALIELLIKLCEKQGVNPDDLAGIKEKNKKKETKMIEP